ncbi:formin-like protein [Neocloeon triangulifer]|uniref:formin-like protein n=1 Tax=Neocloeon triangulifer TaxID=2078957 RepID=UPI00286F4893|nr:formin-like protein [Neocloeon triangulifer]
MGNSSAKNETITLQDAGHSGTLKARPTTLVTRSQLTGSIRTSTLRASTRGEKMQQPMPRDVNEIEKRFTKVLNSMDLPMDKAKLLKQYDLEKKWDMICDQELVHAKDPPSHYLNKLTTYLDPRASRSARKRRMVLDSTSTQVLRDLEISLRTNHIEWVREFLNEENKGLDVLVGYLSFRLMMLRREQKGDHDEAPSPNGSFIGATNHNRPTLNIPDSPSVKRQSRHIAKLNMGESLGDIHVCIMCLRAIMNNKYGFNLVIQHSEAINCIALSLIHKSLRTKALVLELLAAICLVKGGHEIILGAFNNFKNVLSEKKRFQTLMHYFMNESFYIDFMVACMQFVNIIVHSVEDMNFRVHLQYEFTSLGLDQYLENLRHTESEELKVQILAYLDNVFDVHALMEDSELKTVALERVADLEEELGHAHDRLAEVERESLYKIAELETALANMRTERDELLNKWQSADHEVSTLRKQFNAKESESLKRQSLLESKIKELQASSLSGDNSSSCSSLSSPSHSSSSLPTPAPPPPAPPMPMANQPPPPPPMMGKGPPMPPPPPGMMAAPDGAMTIKRKVETKHKLPTLNWVAMKPNQVRGTVFNELDDDKLFNIINFQEFEEQFKIGNTSLAYANNSEVDGLNTYPSKRFKKPETISLLEHTRLRNLAISRRKIDMTIERLISALNSLDLKQLSLENVEIIQKMLPTEQETKLYKEYVIERKNIDLLSDEDKFLMQLSKIERVATKLSIMSYMGNFIDNLHVTQPQILAVISSSKSVRNSAKFRKLLEVILAFGNYLNSSKRGPAYGFKLQSLDTLLDTKSSDKRMSLLNYIVQTVKQYFPELMNFDSELSYIEKASAVSLENVVHDVQELERGMDNARKELELRTSFKEEVVVLKDFLMNSEDKMRKLMADAKNAQESFRDCVEYFGESPRQMDANVFFSVLTRFVKAFKAADVENEQRLRLQAAAHEHQQAAMNGNHDGSKKLNGQANSQKKQQEAVITELKQRARLVQETRLMPQDEVYNGALEDILLGLKNEPYRRADAVRRSQRRHNRLSRNMEDFDM